MLQRILGIGAGIISFFVIWPLVSVPSAFVAGEGISSTIVSFVLYAIIAVLIWFFSKKKFATFASSYLLVQLGIGLLVIIMAIGVRFI